MTTENKPKRFVAYLERLKHLSARDVVHGIENAWKNLVTLIDKARETYYRLVILNNETFEEVNSFKLSVFNFYVAVSTLFVGFTALGMALIVFTPLKKIIPGYGGYGSERAVFDLYERVDSLEIALKYHETYTNNFRKMLVADVETEKDVPKDKTGTPSVLDSNMSVDPSESELKIRAGGGDPFEDSEMSDESSTKTSEKAIRVIGRNDRLESMYLQAPVAGSINLTFSLEKKHYGVDITAPKNTAIKSITDGFVILCDWTLETGNTIAIQHSNNVVSFYKHNSTLLKKVGDKVKTGEAIAIIGNTGEQTTGPHLHFELWKDGKAVNPEEYIRF